MSKVFRDTWPARRMDLPPLAEHECNAGPGPAYADTRCFGNRVIGNTRIVIGATCDNCAGQCEAGKPCPGRLFKTDEQMRADGWEPVSDWKVAKFIGSCVVAILAFVAIVNIGARWAA